MPQTRSSLRGRKRATAKPEMTASQDAKPKVLIGINGLPARLSNIGDWKPVNCHHQKKKFAEMGKSFLSILKLDVRQIGHGRQPEAGCQHLRPEVPLLHNAANRLVGGSLPTTGTTCQVGRQHRQAP